MHKNNTTDGRSLGAQSVNSITHGNYIMDLKDILTSATDNWQEILICSGMDSSFLKKGHGPCPAPYCGGKDRFRFDNKAGRGTYFCNQCGAGDGLDLLKKFRGWSTAEALNFVSDFMKIRPKHVIRHALPHFKKVLEVGEMELEKKAKALEKELRRHQSLAVEAPLSHEYLVRKGITLNNIKCVHDYLIIPVYKGKLQLVSYQRIWGNGKKMFLYGTNKKGAYSLIGHYHPDQPIILCESFSTAFSIHQSLHISCWFSFGHQGFEDALKSILSHFEHKGQVIIACDADASGVSVKSAEQALQSLASLASYNIKHTNIVVPDRVGYDFNDLHLAHGSRAVRTAFKGVL